MLSVYLVFHFLRKENMSLVVGWVHLDYVVWVPFHAG